MEWLEVSIYRLHSYWAGFLENGLMPKQNHHHEDGTQQTSDRGISALRNSWRSLLGFNSNWQVHLSGFFNNNLKTEPCNLMNAFCERWNLPGFKSSCAGSGERHFSCWFLLVRTLIPTTLPQPSCVNMQCTEYRAAFNTPRAASPGEGSFWVKNRT